MYALVNDIRSYPQFLRWCTNADIVDATDTHLRATLFIEAGKIRQSFTTENTMQAGRQINMRLVKGPFRFLTGCWKFEPLGEQQCRVALDIEFEFKNKLLKLALNHTFSHIMNHMVESFSQRAREIYGQR